MRDKNRFFCQLRCNIQKTVKLDSYTFEIINSYRGNNFSEKLRNYVFDVDSGLYKK